MPPVSLLVKPASGSCNMRCRYCFYADEQNKRAVAVYGMMSEKTMRAVIDQAFAYAAGSDCSVAFQGGEPTLAGLEFYRALTSYAAGHELAPKTPVRFSIQTNALALDEEWASFLAEHHFLVGVSLDGMQYIHDRYRIDAQGKGTYDRVMDAVRLLAKYGVETNILTVVTSASARKGGKLYRFFRDNGLEFQQYIECLDPMGEVPGGREYSLTPEKYGRFLKDLFDAWYLDWEQGKGSYNRYFENLLMLLAGQRPESCGMAGVCSPQWVIEADGSTYPCDFYALDEWLLGNINRDSLSRMDERRKELGFIAWSRRVHEDCKTCQWFFLCRGGCRRHREPVRADAAGKNYFCAAYQDFFSYAYSRLLSLCRGIIAEGTGKRVQPPDR